MFTKLWKVTINFIRFVCVCVCVCVCLSVYLGSHCMDCHEI